MEAQTLLITLAINKPDVLRLDFCSLESQGDKQCNGYY